MAYTAAALSFMLAGYKKPIVLTGAAAAAAAVVDQIDPYCKCFDTTHQDHAQSENLSRPLPARVPAAAAAPTI